MNLKLWLLSLIISTLAPMIFTRKTKAKPDKNMNKNKDPFYWP